MYLIDAYNWLLRSAQAPLSQTELDRWTERVASLLKLSCRPSKLIFDAPLSPRGIHKKWIEGIEVIYTCYGQSADDFILESLLGQQPGTCSVVTSDRQLARSARELGAKTLSIAEFTRKLTRPARASPSFKSSAKLCPVQTADKGNPLHSALQREIAYYCQAFEWRFFHEKSNPQR